MKALVFTDLGVVKIQEVPDVAAGEGDVVIVVDRAGICGSELHGISSPGFRVPPLIMGHEFVGHTTDGRRVAVNPLTSCGGCDLCAIGKPQLCRSRSLLGVHKSGGFAERVLVPEGSIHELPDDLDLDRAALIEPLANAVHAWNLAGAPKGQRVGVIGCGPIGLACVEIAHYAGAATVTATDLSESRRIVAEKVGADLVSDALVGEFDVIFDAVGSATTHQSAVDHLIAGGTTVWLGLASPDPGFDALGIVRLEKNIRGSFAYSDEEFVEAIGIAPSLDLSWSTTYPLDQGAEIFTALMNGETTPIKALLQP
ncbi:MAG: alcohol dehydrogenase catalytic domain-containing protein [Acidimicrobiales bacterium]|jgi:threonine dehydrogenase-like Zn-dependent dehydrogenase